MSKSKPSRLLLALCSAIRGPLVCTHLPRFAQRFRAVRSSVEPYRCQTGAGDCARTGRAVLPARLCRRTAFTCQLAEDQAHRLLANQSGLFPVHGHSSDLMSMRTSASSTANTRSPSAIACWESSTWPRATLRIPNASSETSRFTVSEVNGDWRITDIEPNYPHPSRAAALQWINQKLSQTSDPATKPIYQHALECLQAESLRLKLSRQVVRGSQQFWGLARDAASSTSSRPACCSAERTGTLEDFTEK